MKRKKEGKKGWKTIELPSLQYKKGHGNHVS
jgi:hypothetical protein